VSPFIVLPVVAGVFWLIHAAVTVTGSSAHRYTRWILFGGLPALAVVNLLSGGIVGFMFALVTVLTWLGMILLEVTLNVVLLLARGQAKRAT
jgi:hypothetical protein